MALYIAAAKAARMRDLKAHVVTAEGKHRALALWDHSRDWDPGDCSDHVVPPTRSPERAPPHIVRA
jgi:hypothetical protein